MRSRPSVYVGRVEGFSGHSTSHGQPSVALLGSEVKIPQGHDDATNATGTSPCNFENFSQALSISSADILFGKDEELGRKGEEESM